MAQQITAHDDDDDDSGDMPIAVTTTAVTTTAESMEKQTSLACVAKAQKRQEEMWASDGRTEEGGTEEAEIDIHPKRHFLCVHGGE